VSFGFLFTTSASNDYSLLCSLPVKKRTGLKKVSGIRNEFFSLLVNAGMEKEKKEEKRYA